jgi:biopolymer transport protein ExbD
LEKFEPFGLRSNQFGLIAAITLLAAWIPNLVSIPSVSHIVEMDILPDVIDRHGERLHVDVLETSEIRANGLPVSLLQLNRLAHKKQSAELNVVLTPAPCAPYDIVIKTIVALKIAGPKSVALADPDYPTSFDRASRPVAGNASNAAHRPQITRCRPLPARLLR